MPSGRFAQALLRDGWWKERDILNSSLVAVKERSSRESPNRSSQNLLPTWPPAGSMTVKGALWKALGTKSSGGFENAGAGGTAPNFPFSSLF